MKGVFWGIAMALCAGLWAESDPSRIERLDFTAVSGKILEVGIYVDAGELFIERASSATRGDVVLECDRAHDSPRLEFNEARNRLRVSSTRKKWYRIQKDVRSPVIRIRLPDGVTLRLKVRVKAGRLEFALGGLRIEELDLQTWAGQNEIRFDEPNPIVMRSLDIDVFVGEMRLVSLGNARFERAEINGGIGNLAIDLTGRCENRSMARLDLDIGAATVRLPSDAGIRMRIGGSFAFLSRKEVDSVFERRGRYYYSDDYDRMPVRITVSITPGLGELQIERE